MPLRICQEGRPDFRARLQLMINSLGYKFSCAYFAILVHDSVYQNAFTVPSSEDHDKNKHVNVHTGTII